MRLIGLSGKAGSGKDTVADEILRLTGNFAYKTPFALEVKSVASNLGWNGQKDTNGRVLLQFIGKRERQADPNHWIDLLDTRLRFIEEEAKTSVLFVVSDVRYVNEAEWVLGHPFSELWRIERPNFSGIEGLAAKHETETSLDNYKHFSRVIHNKGDLTSLQRLTRAHLEAFNLTPLPRLSGTPKPNSSKPIE